MCAVSATGRRATIEIGTPAGSIPLSVTPNTTSGTAWSALVDTEYDLSGMRVATTKVYTSTSTSDDSTVGYDAMGRIARSVDATGTITRTVLDERGRVTQRWTGTNDYGWTGPTGSVSGSADMVKTELMEYDANLAMGGGNGHMTKRSQDSSGAWSGGVGDRVTTYSHDYRGRAIVMLGPVAPYSVTKYDNSNRTIASAQYSSTSGLSITTDPAASSASTRVALSETAYDERGQVFQSTRWQITQTGGSAGNKGSSQVTDNWYDADGRLIKTQGPQLSKTVHDRLGRPVDRFLIAKVDDTTYAHASGVSGDLVLEQTHMGLDPTTGRTLAQWLVQRAHDDSSSGTTGALDTNADGLDQKLTAANLTANARPQITAMWYDALDRVSDTVPYGTNGGSDFNRASLSAPSTGANTPKTIYAYDTSGRTYRVTDPAGVISETKYDFAGRKLATTDNYVNGTPGGGTYSDEDRVTEYTYTAGLTTSVKRKMPSSGDDQETTYAYDTTGGSSIIKRKNLLTSVVYPEQTGGQSAADRSVTYVYNALSQATSTSDPEGNVISTTYDAGGRTTARTVTTYASSGIFDTRVQEIDSSYNSRGMLAGTLQKDASSVTLDEVTFDYDGWGNMSTFTQDPDSAVGISGRTEFQLTWTYGLNSTSGCNRALYPTNWTQPGATSASITPGYGGGLDAYARRVSNLVDGYSVTLGDYSYLGLSTIAGMAYKEVYTTDNVGTWLYGTGGSSTYSTYMDRFNRPSQVTWSPGIGGSAAFVNIGFEYDGRGNNTVRADGYLRDAGAKAAFAYLNTYDSLRRLEQREEGELNVGHTAVTTRARIETYARNLAGRLTTDQISLNNDSDYTDGPPTAVDAGEMDDARTYNKRNELRSRSYYDSAHPSTPASITLSYDKNGNLTDDGEKYLYTYNPWGQLVEIKNRTSPYDVQAEFHYNGLGQRIAEHLDCTSAAKPGYTDDLVDSDDPWFFIAVDREGRRVATFRDADDNPKETFTYHSPGARGPSFAGGVALRDRNASLTDPTKWATETASSTRGERLYYVSDPQGSVIALIKNDGTLMEQARYSPTGVPFGIPGGNVKSDGVVNAGTTGTTDYTIVNAMISGGYQAYGDLNLDGVVNSADTTIVSAANGKSGGRNALSFAAVRNRFSSRLGERVGNIIALSLEKLRIRDTRLSTTLNRDPPIIEPPRDGSNTYTSCEWDCIFKRLQGRVRSYASCVATSCIEGPLSCQQIAEKRWNEFEIDDIDYQRELANCNSPRTPTPIDDPVNPPRDIGPPSQPRPKPPEPCKGKPCYNSMSTCSATLASIDTECDQVTRAIYLEALDLVNSSCSGPSHFQSCHDGLRSNGCGYCIPTGAMQYRGIVEINHVHQLHDETCTYTVTITKVYSIYKQDGKCSGW